MNESRYYVVRSEGAKWGVSFGSALAMAISYTTNKSILGRSFTASWAGCMIYFALFKS